MGQTSDETGPSPTEKTAFRLKWQGRYVAGVQRIGHLRRATEVVVARDGADPLVERKLPGRTAYDPVTLELGLTHDADFEDWANAVSGFRSEDGGPPPLPFRRDLTIEVYDESDRLVAAYNLFRCWVSEYQAIPDLDANSNAVLIQRLTLENEGWERDPDLP